MSLENLNSVYNDENHQEAHSTFSNIIKKHYAMCFPKKYSKWHLPQQASMVDWCPEAVHTTEK